ncbi:MAG: 3-deoxy-8-phosphooctulonate synthase [Planctomycetes bacterium]|nr:3-deoxy-8-phosphooctulonate synthase [Planctomycetota bacterium]
MDQPTAPARTVRLDLPRGGSIPMGRAHPLFLLAGPCVVEGREKTLTIARILKEICGELGVPLVFKASYDKANRSSHKSFRGIGADAALAILEEVRAEHGLPLVSDVHESAQVERAANTLDILQVPAFLCRQTDLLDACAKSGRIVNVKKGQFLAPEDMANVAAKLQASGTDRILLTERGVSFGYHTLVTDLRAFPVMRATGWPVVFDGTHSVQQPGGLGDRSGGQRDMIPYLVRGAVACGVDGLFLECHDDPDHALSDGPNNLDLKDLPKLLRDVLAIRRALNEPV